MSSITRARKSFEYGLAIDPPESNQGGQYRSLASLWESPRIPDSIRPKYALSAEVNVVLERAKIMGTDNKTMSYASTTIWSASYLQSGPYATFQSHVIQTSEQIMKSLVNDWTKAQDVFSYAPQ